MQKPPANHPQWALKYRKEGTELRFLKGRYYLYAYKTVYDKGKQRPKKVSGQLLGSITEKDGFIPSAKRALESSANTPQIATVRCKEYGVASLVTSALAQYSE